jgi:dihydropteroate synthase
VILDCGGKPLDLTTPQVMGVLNVTPDSFSDGGRFLAVEAAVTEALRLQEAGAAIIDVGGESTRPGAAPVSAREELARVLPVIEALSAELAVPISVDTSKAEVMAAAIAVGAGFVNDVQALGGPRALEVVAAGGVPVCLMHMQGEPRSMQRQPQYDDVVADVVNYLERRLEVCEAAGIDRGRLLIDPGFGFGKTLEHNLRLLNELASLRRLGVPVLVGLSRKSSLGLITGRPVEQRLAGSVAAAVLAVERGADLVRAHDVAATVDALRVVQAVREAGIGRETGGSQQ